MAGDAGGRGCPGSEMLLHPELLSQEFLLLTLEQKNIVVEEEIKINKDDLTNIYVQHAIPLPQRELPKSRWGKMMEKKRGQNELKNEHKRDMSMESLRKRPLIVFDGNSTSTSIKVRKTENGTNDRLKPPPSNHVLMTSRSTPANVKSPPLSPVGGTTVVKLKRTAPKEEAESVSELKPTEAKRKIQHVTWP
ncbi:ashwin isoform X2 [Gracilinanus agilis]|uniref:ashwin isoform X2 n=1 Tax=Gracilinanus agilis TaxID=191870 RepID=UPI001CFF4C18|nr:ashwin isoform X2 [Gracilinanus agilis]